jgi:hypothetical protein
MDNVLEHSTIRDADVNEDFFALAWVRETMQARASGDFYQMRVTG